VAEKPEDRRCLKDDRREGVTLLKACCLVSIPEEPCNQQWPGWRVGCWAARAWATVLIGMSMLALKEGLQACKTHTFRSGEGRSALSPGVLASVQWETVVSEGTCDWKEGMLAIHITVRWKNLFAAEEGECSREGRIHHCGHTTVTACGKEFCRRQAAHGMPLGAAVKVSYFEEEGLGICLKR